MSKKKMTPAQVAEKIARFIAKQEETLKTYPVGPLGNTAKRNLEKGKKALAALQGKNEEMRMAMQPQGQAAMPSQQMALGGDLVSALPATSEAGTASSMTPSQQAMIDSLSSQYGMSPAIAAAVASVTQKESGGSGTKAENNYSNTSNAAIRGVNTRFARKFKDMPDAELTKLKANPEAFFNYVYDDATGNSAEGDGYKYRGRGLVQVTGKANYKRVSQAVYGDDRLVDNPDLLLDDETAGAAAAYFAAESGKGVKGYVDFDLSTPDPSPEQIQQVLNGSYAVVASGGTLPKAEAQDSAKMAKRYKQFNKSMATMQAFAGVNVPNIQGSNEASAQNTNGSNAVAPQTQEFQEPQVSIPEELDDNKLFELAASDKRTLDFMQRNNVTTSDLNKALAGEYVNIPNRAAFDGLVRKVASDYTTSRNAAIAQTQASRTKDKTGDSIGWSESLGISRERYKELASEAEDEFPDQALAYIPGPEGTEGSFRADITSPMGSARVVTDKPEFAGMQAKINYDNFKAGGEEGLNEGIEMTNAVRAGRDEFADTFMKPALAMGLGAAALAPGAIGLGGLSMGQTGLAAQTLGRQFLAGQALNPAIAGGGINYAGALGSAATAAGMTSGVMRTAGDFGTTDRQNAFEVAMDPDLSALQKAQYFTEIGLELSPALFESPTAIRNIFRGKPSDFPGSRAQYLMARRAGLNKADDASALVDETQDAFRAVQTNRRSFKNTAASAEQKALAAETKATNSPTKANKTAATKARAKAETAKANDAQALRNQQSAGAFRNNAVGRAGVADDELNLFNKRYNTAREPYSFGSTGVLSNTGKLIPAAVSAAPMLANLATSPAQNTPENVRAVSPTIVDPQIQANQIEQPVSDPNQVPTRDGSGTTPGGGTREGVAPLPVRGVEEVASVLPTSEIQTASPEMMQVNMPKMNALQAVPAMASLGSAAIQRRALNAMQGPQRPIETDIPQFAYESNIQSTLDDIRNATNTAARGTNLPQQAAAANQQALMANRFRAEGRARAIDNQAKQQAKARYDAMAYQGRAVQNDLRSKYQDDMVGFNNQKAMLDAQIKQQPLNVLASSTQDYLKNIYAPNLAAMFESQGRQYGTNYTEENT
jgi:putative chitinase